MTETDEWLRMTERRIDKLELTGDKLQDLEHSMETRFKSVEVNIATLKGSMDTHFASLNGTVTNLRESDIRRDERERIQEKMLTQIQTNTRWYVVTAIMATGAIVTVLERFL